MLFCFNQLLFSCYSNCVIFKNKIFLFYFINIELYVMHVIQVAAYQLNTRLSNGAVILLQGWGSVGVGVGAVVYICITPDHLYL